MILDALIVIVGIIFGIVLQLINVIVGAFDLFVDTTAVTVQLPTYLGYVFGNIFLLNDLLPVTSFFILLTLALAFHISIFSLKVVFFMMDVTAKVYRFFVSVRG